MCVVVSVPMPMFMPVLVLVLVAAAVRTRSGCRRPAARPRRVLLATQGLIVVM
jgi:hypothetical protein